MHQELTAQRSQEAANRRRLDEAQARLEEQRKYLDRLQHDPDYVAKVIRQQLRYAKPSELIFRFED